MLAVEVPYNSNGVEDIVRACKKLQEVENLKNKKRKDDVIIAWRMPKEKMNNNPLKESEVRKRFKEKELHILDYNYKNSLTRLLCLDKEGYKVKVSLGSLCFNTKEYARFSPTANIEGFLYNLNHYRNLNPQCAEVIDWKYVYVGSKKKKHVHLLCVCNECKEQFWVHLTDWKRINCERNRCSNCVHTESNLEIKVRHWLEEEKIKFIPQYRFEDCRGKRKLPFDFYLPDYNICIEVDGEQHYKVGVRIKGITFTEEDLKEIQKHDKIKTQYCLRQNIKLIRLPYFLFRSKNGYKRQLSKEIFNQ